MDTVYQIPDYLSNLDQLKTENVAALAVTTIIILPGLTAYNPDKAGLFQLEHGVTITGTVVTPTTVRTPTVARFYAIVTAILTSNGQQLGFSLG